MRLLKEFIHPRCLKESETHDEHSMDSILFIIFLLGLRVMMDKMAEISRVAQAQEDWVELCQRTGFQFLKPWPAAGLSEELA